MKKKKLFKSITVLLLTVSITVSGFPASHAADTGAALGKQQQTGINGEVQAEVQTEVQTEVQMQPETEAQTQTETSGGAQPETGVQTEPQNGQQPDTVSKEKQTEGTEPDTKSQTEETVPEESTEVPQRESGKADRESGEAERTGQDPKEQQKILTASRIPKHSKFLQVRSQEELIRLEVGMNDGDFYVWYESMMQEQEKELAPILEQYDPENAIRKRYAYLKETLGAVLDRAGRSASDPQLAENQSRVSIGTLAEFYAACESKDGGTVNLTSGVKPTRKIEVTGSVYLKSDGGYRVNSSYKGGSMSLFNIARGGSLRLATAVRLSSDAGMDSGYTGGAFRVYGTLTLESGAVINGFRTESDGGGVFVEVGGTLNMKPGSLIQNCTAINQSGGSSGSSLGYGGGIFTAQRSEVNISGGEIKNCSAARNGGGISYHGAGGAVTISNLSLHHNSVYLSSDSGSGGGIFLSGLADSYQVTFLNCSIYSNTAVFGGGISSRIPISISGCSIYENSASRHGGGIVSRGYMSVNNGTSIYSNMAVTDAGAIYVGEGTTELSNVSIYGNGNANTYGIRNEGYLHFKGNVHMGFTSYTNDRNFVASNNGKGNVHNYGTFNIYNMSGYCRLVCTTNFNVCNEKDGVFNVYDSQGGGYPVFTGSSTHAILNYGRASLNRFYIFDAAFGIVNYGGGSLSFSGGTIQYSKNRGIHNADSDGLEAFLVMESGSVLNSGTAGTNDLGSGIYNAGRFIQRGGSVCYNSATANGGGIYNARDFSMEGGEVYGNTQTRADASGGGGIGNTGTFRMLAGEIHNNTSARYGGGVRNDGTFLLSGGEITWNSALAGGGIFTGGDTSLTLSGGLVSWNQATHSGGGILSGSTLKLSGTTKISGNRAGNQGGGICQTGGVLEMSGGSIADNQSVGSGGGAAVSGQTVFHLRNGSVSGNKSIGTDAQAGGIFTDGQAVLSMSGGTVSLNTAANAGGAICQQSTGTSTISGGEIYANSASADFGTVLVTRGTLHMSGGSLYDNNTCGLYLYAGSAVLSGGSIYGNRAAWSGGPGGIYNYNAAFQMSGGFVYGNTGCGLYNGAKDGSTTKSSAQIKGGFIGLSGWNSDVDYPSYASGNSGGGIYNAKNASLSFGGSSGRIYASEGYGIRNYGTLDLSPTGKMAVYGSCSYGIDNNAPGSITNIRNTTVDGSATGVWNNSSIRISDLTVKNITSRGIHNDAGGTMTAAGLSIDTAPDGLYNLGDFTLTSGSICSNTRQSVYQSGTFRISGSPVIENQIFLTPGHFVTVTGSCTSNLIMGLGQSDTFDGRVLANYTFTEREQTKRYSLEQTKTQGYADANYLEIKDGIPEDTAYKYQVLLKQGEKVLIQYSGNPQEGEEEKITGSVERDIVPLESIYTMRDNGFAYERHAYTGWDQDKKPYGWIPQFQEGDKVDTEELVKGQGGLSTRRLPRGVDEDSISVRDLVKKVGRAATLAESEEYDYVVDLYAIWNQEPEIDVVPLEFYENEKVTGKDLMAALTDSVKGAKDKEDGKNNHDLDSQVRIVKIQYGSSAGNSAQGIAPVKPGIDGTFVSGMSDGYVMGTDYGFTLKQEERVTNTITFQVTDSAGNTVQKDCSIYVRYNYAPEIRVFRNLIYTTREVQENPFTGERLLALVSPSDVEDDLAKRQGLTGEDGLVVDIARSFGLQGIQKEGAAITAEEIREPGTYTVTYTATDRFGKTTVRSADIVVVEPGALTEEEVRYVRFISLKHLGTLEEHSKWDKEELRKALEKETPDYELSLTYEQVQEIKAKMEGFGSSKAAAESIIREIANTYLP